eukprot:583377-Prymnesium_polylepis.1
MRAPAVRAALCCWENISAIARAGGVPALFRKLKDQVMSRSGPGPIVGSSIRNVGEVCLAAKRNA